MRKIMVLIFVLVVILPIQINNYTNTVNLDSPVEEHQLNEWEIFILAITWVESEHNDNAKNSKSSATGRFQQLKIYVDDVNRILGYNAFGYDDRLDSIKSRQMFDIIQNHYNPNKDINKAIRLHRGLNSQSYINAVYEKINYYNKLQNI